MKTNGTSMKDSTFALFFGNRGFFPESLIAAAREEMRQTLEKLGHQVLMMEASATRYGAVESPAEGAKFAKFLEENRGRFEGVILCLPNFGDETGAVAALQDARVPILVHAYPDELNKMGFAHRRDAFCGKFSIMDVFYQYGVPFTTFQPHTVHPTSATFAQHVEWFAGVCRIVQRMKRMTVGAFGARTTAFKTVRFDELTLQRYGITTETLDLSEVISRARNAKATTEAFRLKAETLRNYTHWKGVPEAAFETIVKLGVVLDELIEEYHVDAMSLRCWLELEKELKVSPCVLLSEINHRGIPAACELDVCNAVSMFALGLASQRPATCLDWNNNYGEDPDKCILFHCGPVPQGLMVGKGQIVDHPMFAKVLGDGCGFGCNVGRIAAGPMTYCSSKTEGGALICYLGEGEITSDPIAQDFFGCAGVAHIKNLQPKLQKIGYQGFRHHLSMTPKHVAIPVREAFQRYLSYQFIDL